jgi:hypothetical protein
MLLVGRTIVFRGLPPERTDDERRSSVPLTGGAFHVTLRETARGDNPVDGPW